MARVGAGLPGRGHYYEDDVPDQWSGYTQINADFFAELGLPGGASKVGMTENDPQVVKDLPLRVRTDNGSPALRKRVSASLPVFPWDTLADATALALPSRRDRRPVGGHAGRPGGTADPGGPGRRQRRARPSDHRRHAGAARIGRRGADRRYGVTGLADGAVLPVIGTKELIAVPTLLGMGPDDVVVVPELAYPTYEVGSQLAGAQVARADSLTQLGPQSPALVYLNSPSNPTGKVLGVEHLHKVVGWARERGVLVASDECYLGLGWDAEPLSVLHPSVSDGDHRAVGGASLSKSSSLAGYRAGFVAGDLAVVAELLAVRKHAGMMVPTPVQAAMVAALDDDVRARTARAVNGAGPRCCRAARGGADRRSFRGRAVSVGDRGEPCRDTVRWLAQRGILVAPGEFYGPRGAQHVRIALTATDERVAAAADRLSH